MATNALQAEMEQTDELKRQKAAAADQRAAEKDLLSKAWGDGPPKKLKGAAA